MNDKGIARITIARITERLEKAKSDQGVYAKFYVEDIHALLEFIDGLEFIDEQTKGIEGAAKTLEAGLLRHGI